MLKGASPRPKPQTSLVAGPLLLGRGDLGIGENVEEDWGYFIALVSMLLLLFARNLQFIDDTTGKNNCKVVP